MSFIPLENPIGFGVVDALEFTTAFLLVTLALGWKRLSQWAHKVAARPGICMIFFAILPVFLRLILLPSHPIPTPDLYDEFGHLLVADTLRHWRLANPTHVMHRFFETFFVLQQPTYSSIYPLGNGLLLAIGWTIFGTPWAGVLLSAAAFCSLCYWMLRGWTPPQWALLGGMLAVFEFGPINAWTNEYWGGGLAAAAGCLVFGALPRRNWILLGLGLGIHLITRPYESLFLFLAVGVYFIHEKGFGRVPLRGWVGIALVLAAVSLTLLQNKRVTGQWTKLPYQLSQEQYGVPAVLTFQSTPTPRATLTREQELDYRMQSNFHPGRDTVRSYFDRLYFRARYYRFYFYAVLYPALAVFLVTIRSFRSAWVALTCLLFALGTNFFPAFQFHYLAAIVCLFVLMSVEGMRKISESRYGRPVARLIIFFCVVQFAFWYCLHLPDSRAFAAESCRFDLWDSINHTNPKRRIAIAHELSAVPGKLLIFVRYWPQHVFQDEWVYNGADIDSQRIVWARDLGDEEDQKLAAWYGDRKTFLLEPDARPPHLEPWTPSARPAIPEPQQTKPGKNDKPPNHPVIELEQVR